MKFASSTALQRFSGTLVAFFILAACGIDQGGMQTPSGNQAAVSQTTVVSGPITGFGSIHVNGLVLETSGAEIRIDGNPASELDLREGQIIRAIAVDDGLSTRALSVEYEESLIGPIGLIEPVSAALTVLGRVVLTDAGTRFDSPQVTELSDLMPGELVRVSGYALPTGETLATYIGRAAPLESSQITGAITAVDAAGLNFDLGDLNIDYSQALVLQVPNGVPALDVVVEVKGSVVAGILVADEVRSLSLLPGLFDATATMLTAVESPIVSAATSDTALAANFIGFITAVNLPGRVSLADVDVLLDADTQILGGIESDLVNGARIQVEGDISNFGQIQADRVRIF